MTTKIADTQTSGTKKPFSETVGAFNRDKVRIVLPEISQTVSIYLTLDTVLKLPPEDLKETILKKLEKHYSEDTLRNRQR